MPPRLSAVYEFSDLPLPEFVATPELPNQEDCRRFVTTARTFIDGGDTSIYTTEDRNTRYTKAAVWLDDGIIEAKLVDTRTRDQSPLRPDGVEVRLNIRDENDTGKWRDLLIGIHFSRQQVSGWRLITTLGLTDKRSLPENCGDFDELPVLEDEGVSLDSEEEPLIAIIGKIMTPHHEEVPSGLSLQPGDITKDPFYAETKQKAEQMLENLADNDELRSLIDLCKRRLEQRYHETKITNVSKQTLNRLSDLLQELATSR